MNKAYYGLYIFSVSIAAFSQILLKKSANKVHKKWLYEYLNPLVVCGYGILCVSMVLTTLALKIVPYKMGGIIESLSYLFIFVFSTWLLKEKVTKKRIVGNLIIIVGIIIFNL